MFSKQVLVNIRTILDWFKVHTRIVVTTHKAQDFMSAKKEEPPGDPRLSAHFVIGPLFGKVVSRNGPINEDALYYRYRLVGTSL